MNSVIGKVFLVLITTGLFLVGIYTPLCARNRIVLSASKPLSSQITMAEKGTLFVVEADFNLNGERIKLPEGAILQFEGGLFFNGELYGNNTRVMAGKYEIFRALTLSGTWSLDGIPVEWFGAESNREDFDCAKAINASIAAGVAIMTPAVLGSGTYYIKSTIEIPDNGALIGSSPSSTTIRYFEEAGIGLYLHGQHITLRDVSVREDRMERKGICIKVGDYEKKVSCTRGYLEDVSTLGGNYGLDLEYQWGNRIAGIKCYYNGIGLRALSTTPYVENAVIEGNYKCGVLSETSGIKLYNAIIEGNTVGCVLNGKENLLINCYFEGNTASQRDEKAKRDAYGFDVEGGHIYAGEAAFITNLIMIGCHIVNTYKNNNTIRIDKCLNFTSIGCNSLDYLDLTENCTVKYIDNTFDSVEDYGEYSLASRVPRGFSVENPYVFQCSDFGGLRISDTEILLDEKGYYRLIGNKSRFELLHDGSLLCQRKESVKYREIYFRVSDPRVLEGKADIALSSTVQYPQNMNGITPSQGISLTGKTKAGKTVTVKIGKGYTSTNRKIRAGETTTYEVRIKRSHIDKLVVQNGIAKIDYLSMYNSLVYESTGISSDRKAGNEFVLVGLSVALEMGR